MAKKKTYAAVMDDMSKKLRTYETRLQEAQQRGDAVGMQDYGRRIQRVQAGIETLFNTQESSKQPQVPMQMRYGGIPRYGDGTPSTITGDDVTRERGLRNNNPGNLRKWGDRPRDNGFAVFDTPEQGWKALVRQLERYQEGLTEGTDPNMSLIQAMEKYAPAKDKNNPVEYAKRIAKALGVDPNKTPIKDINAEDWAAAVSRTESPQMYAVLQESNLLPEAMVSKLPEVDQSTRLQAQSIVQGPQQMTPTMGPQQSNNAYTQEDYNAYMDALRMAKTSPEKLGSYHRNLIDQMAGRVIMAKEMGVDPSKGWDGLQDLNQERTEYIASERAKIDPLAGLGTVPVEGSGFSPEFIASQELEGITDADFVFEKPIDETAPVGQTLVDPVSGAGTSTVTPTTRSEEVSSGAVTPEQRAQYEAAEAAVDAERSATNEQGDLAGLFGQLVPEQNKFAQYGQFLPDLYAAYQMEQVGAPVGLPSQTMARMNTDVNYNPIYAQARQQQAEQNAMIDRNVSNPVVAAALKRSAANQTQATMGQTMASEIDQERQLSNQYAQSIAQNKNLNAQIAAQNQQQQIDFQNQKRAARAQMLQQAGTKLGQLYGENQNRQAQIQQLGLSALQFEGDMLGRMGTNLEAMKAAGLI